MKCGNGGHVQYPPFPSFDHVAGEKMGQAKIGNNIYFDEHFLPVQGKSVKVSISHQSGIVHEDMDDLSGPNDFFIELLRPSFGGEIDGIGINPDAVTVLQIFRPGRQRRGFRRVASQKQMRPLLRKDLGKGLADAGRRSGNQDVPVRERVHSSSVFLEFGSMVAMHSQITLN